MVDAPIAVRVTDGEETFNLVPPESGLGIDIEATVDAVPGASANPFSLVRALFGAGAVDPVPSVDRAALEAAVTAIAEQADVEPVNGSVAFADGAVVTSPATLGRMVDVAAGADAIETTYFGAPGPHELPLPTRRCPPERSSPRSPMPTSRKPLTGSPSRRCPAQSPSRRVAGQQSWNRR